MYDVMSFHPCLHCTHTTTSRWWRQTVSSSCCFLLLIPGRDRGQTRMMSYGSSGVWSPWLTRSFPPTLHLPLDIHASLEISESHFHHSVFWTTSQLCMCIHVFVYFFMYVCTYAFIYFYIYLFIAQSVLLSDSILGILNTNSLIIFSYFLENFITLKLYDAHKYSIYKWFFCLQVKFQLVDFFLHTFYP